MVEEVPRELLVLLPRIAELLTVERRRDADVVVPGQVVADEAVTEERVREMRRRVAQAAGLDNDPRAGREDVYHEREAGQLELRADDDRLDVRPRDRWEVRAHPQRDVQARVVRERGQERRIDLEIDERVVILQRRNLQQVHDGTRDSRAELLDEHAVLELLLLEEVVVEVLRVEAEQLQQRRPGVGVELVVLVARARELEAQPQIAVDRQQLLVGVASDR